jgi:ubiquinone/menaquinone biosynthesis C-methylase UbiE
MKPGAPKLTPTFERDYLHGYSSTEQQRLVRQAEYWREKLIPIGLSYQPGEQVLEIGCAAGATLAVLAQVFPGIGVAGVDIEPHQIDFAGTHLRSSGVDADLRVGDGANLPWANGSFDHVYIMWLLEHLKDSTAILREAHRVLRRQGTITLTETDYTSFKVTPPSADWDYLENAQFEFFARHGNPIAGRQLGVLLRGAGFAEVRNAPVGFHFFQGARGFREHVDYILEFLEPGLAKMVPLGFNEMRLRSGIEYLRSIPDRENGSMTTIVYRAQGTRRETEKT